MSTHNVGRVGRGLWVFYQKAGLHIRTPRMQELGSKTTGNKRREN